MGTINESPPGAGIQNPGEYGTDPDIRDDRVKGAMEKILSVVESGNFEIVARAVFERSNVPSDSWSFMNRILMYFEGTEDARGFRQWGDAQRYVKAGSKAFYILAPCRRKMWRTVKTIEYQSSGNGDKIPVEKSEVKQIDTLMGFRAVPVFKYEDTDGKEIKNNNPGWKVPFAFGPIVNELNLSVKARGWGEGCYGFYAPVSKVICVHSPDIEVFLHELAHAVDDKLHGLKMGQQADQETIAEFSAAVVASVMGYEIKTGAMAHYIQHYGLKELIRHIARAEKVIRYIVDRTRTDAPGTTPTTPEAFDVKTPITTGTSAAAATEAST